MLLEFVRRRPDFYATIVVRTFQNLGQNVDWLCQAP